MDEPTREEFLRAVAQEDRAEAERLLGLLGPRPSWLEEHDVVLNYALLRVVQAQIAEARETLIEVQKQQAFVTGAFQLYKDGPQADDLETFQAGYERGYAQGWRHGQGQLAMDTDEPGQSQA